MNRLSLERQSQIISSLVEGNSIRSTERMFDTHRDTTMRLTVCVGNQCATIMDEPMRNLTCQRIQVDEIWAYVQKKQRNVTRFDDRQRVGDHGQQMVADGLLPVDRLIFLGYPLHPAGDKEKLRDSHLYRIQSPMLFFAGTRDSLCDMNKLKGVLQKLKAPWQLFVIEGGDHSFHVPKAFHKTEQEIFTKIVQKSLEWLK